MRSLALISILGVGAAACGDGDKAEGSECGVELASIFPEDGATGTAVDDLVVVVELSPGGATGSVDVLDPDGNSVWGNIDTTPIEVEFLFGDLQPNTEYTVEISMAPGEGELVCNEATTTFTTGS